MTADKLSNNQIRNILEEASTIAMVGLSGNWFRPSFFAAKYLLDHGYKVIPVNPNYDEILGQPCVPDLASIDEPVDVVDLFQRAEQVPGFIDGAEKLGAKIFWMQLGIANEEAATEARNKGMTVVMDRCMKIEYAEASAALTGPASTPESSPVSARGG
ncbi:MAG: CoA-binding protein [Candidatus Azotimanducaceae bacterium WSBS_2022_MAG_OTU7]